ncbi:hypothetical protein [Rossellomorea marisflavi]|uniref:hypothetical protein n=1 Tax=Rossellomorea marisflavi TaxID=189381 RepID=UPI0015C47623|nr:hypothetical protein [Rossellomorea marisflavi]
MGDDVYEVPKINVHIMKQDGVFVADAIKDNRTQAQVEDNSPFFVAIIAYKFALEKN